MDCGVGKRSSLGFKMKGRKGGERGEKVLIRKDYALGTWDIAY